MAVADRRARRHAAAPRAVAADEAPIATRWLAASTAAGEGHVAAAPIPERVAGNGRAGAQRGGSQRWKPKESATEETSAPGGVRDNAQRLQPKEAAAEEADVLSEAPASAATSSTCPSVHADSGSDDGGAAEESSQDDSDSESGGFAAASAHGAGEDEAPRDREPVAAARLAAPTVVQPLGSFQVPVQRPPAPPVPAVPAALLQGRFCTLPPVVTSVPARPVVAVAPPPPPPPSPMQLLVQEQQRIVNTLAASPEVAWQLMAAARLVKDALAAQGIPEGHSMMYGSLALSRGLSASLADAPLEASSAFITNRSDVDFAVLLPERVEAMSLVNIIMQLGAESAGWRHEQATVVPRFAVSQWTLVSEKGVRLDITCFTNAAAFGRFRERQAAFREVFMRLRDSMQATFGAIGGPAFDGYIYMLKAFAAVDSGSGAVTSFQAICLGLFVLQHERKLLVPSANWLFNKFLNFCCCFFGRKGPGRRGRAWSSCQAIDMSGQGMFIPRINQRPQAELYFSAAEERCGAPMTEWLNVLHNVDAAALCGAARASLREWFEPEQAQRRHRRS